MADNPHADLEKATRETIANMPHVSHPELFQSKPLGPLQTGDRNDDTGEHMQASDFLTETRGPIKSRADAETQVRADHAKQRAANKGVEPAKGFTPTTLKGGK